MSVILHEGLRFPSNYTKLVSAKELSGHSLQWALGALVYHTRCLPVRWAGRRVRSPIAVLNQFPSSLFLPLAGGWSSHPVPLGGILPQAWEDSLRAHSTFS